MSKKNIFISIIIILILAVAGFFIFQNSGPGKYDQFAQCLKNKGAVFYGAFWCSHCQNQKKEFGSAQKFLPYIECSTPDGSAQTAECNANKIESYPTWIFSDGSRLNGEIPLSQLAEKTSCSLPQ